MSPNKTCDHPDINDEQKNALIFLQRQSNSGADFTRDINEIQEIERKKAVVVSQADMNKLKDLRLNEIGKGQNKTSVCFIIFH
jgi:hypothetical protein